LSASSSLSSSPSTSSHDIAVGVVVAGIVVFIIVAVAVVAGCGSVESGSWEDCRMPHSAELLPRTGWT
jgi:hypothetical protein